MTSGGTESILTAVKTSRDYMRAKKGIRRPEMVVGQSAHAAFFKAAEYFKVKLVVVGCPSMMSIMPEDQIQHIKETRHRMQQQLCMMSRRPIVVSKALPRWNPFGSIV